MMSALYFKIKNIMIVFNFKKILHKMMILIKGPPININTNNNMLNHNASNKNNNNKMKIKVFIRKRYKNLEKY